MPKTTVFAASADRRASTSPRHRVVRRPVPGDQAPADLLALKEQTVRARLQQLSAAARRGRVEDHGARDDVRGRGRAGTGHLCVDGRRVAALDNRRVCGAAPG
ncbi:hypothetical protein PV334_33730 [Streptomyces sp. ME02-7008A-1]|uniref:hypothetical protein n=1 Tax=unclassified Streptomyces TaxID=2593676 RepID=UPI0029BD940A|nr:MULTISPECIES: hypothetical protein [unclassified Streptomyces]MDX3186202.1 hypothetical protein [Streptomyces sp. ME02-7008A-1]MDX3307060.1 hypothetical protein [Streptomyces sp. ME02-7008A]